MRTEEPAKRQRLLDATAWRGVPAPRRTRDANSSRTGDSSPVDVRHALVVATPRPPWDALTRHPRSKGCEDQKSVPGSQGTRASTVASAGAWCEADRDHGRDRRPGARHLNEVEGLPKYLTPETPIYKSRLLWPRLARESIATDHRVVIVEGPPTSAAHVAGVCSPWPRGTAFGSAHSRIIRRLLGDPPARRRVLSCRRSRTGPR